MVGAKYHEPENSWVCEACGGEHHTREAAEACCAEPAKTKEEEK